MYRSLIRNDRGARQHHHQKRLPDRQPQATPTISIGNGLDNWRIRNTLLIGLLPTGWNQSPEN